MTNAHVEQSSIYSEINLWALVQTDFNVIKDPWLAYVEQKICPKTQDLLLYKYYGIAAEFVAIQIKWNDGNCIYIVVV